MKSWKNLIAAISILIISVAVSYKAEARPRGCHRPHYYHYSYGYHRPYRRVYYAPRRVVVHPAYGYRYRGYYYSHPRPRPYVAYHHRYYRHRR